MHFSNAAFDVDYSLDRDEVTATVNGTIHNRLAREISTVLLSFHFYDAEEVRVSQEQVFVNELEPDERVRFSAGVDLDADQIYTVRLVKAEPIPLSEYPELFDAEDAEGASGEQPRH